jgi:hypothetical protein
MTGVMKSASGDTSDSVQQSRADFGRVVLKSRIGVAFGVGAISVALGACGGVASSSTPRTAISVPPGATIQPGASVSATPTGIGLYPAVDTPVASAPSAMAYAWLQLSINKTIPGSAIFSKAPAMPTVINKTNGAVSAADAQAIESALWREETLLQWAEAHDERGFMFNTLLGN